MKPTLIRDRQPVATIPTTATIATPQRAALVPASGNRTTDGFALQAVLAARAGRCAHASMILDHVADCSPDFAAAVPQ
jgi:hypothetical protein